MLAKSKPAATVMEANKKIFFMIFFLQRSSPLHAENCI